MRRGLSGEEILPVENGIMTLLRTIGILGGTFDPIHNGHLHLAKYTLQSLHLQELRLIPAAQPLLRDAPSATAEQRLAMIQLAIQGIPGLVVDDREIHRNGPSYTVDTLADIRRDVGQAPVCFIMGVEQFSQLEKWHQWPKLLSLAHLVVHNRAGFSLQLSQEIATVLQQRQIEDKNLLHQTPAGAIFLQEIPPLMVSGTEVRRRLLEKDNPQQLLPEKVWKYICENQLYR